MRTCIMASCISSAMRLITEYWLLISRESSRLPNCTSARWARYGRAFFSTTSSPIRFISRSILV